MEKTIKSGTWASLKNCLVGPIDSIDQVERNIKETRNGFYFLVGLQIVLSFFIHQNFIIDALIILSLVTILQKNKSRTAAILLFIYSASTIIVTFNNRITHENGGQNIYLSLIMTAYSFISIRATFVYHKLIASKVQWGNLFKLQAYALFLSIILFFLAVLILMFTPIKDDSTKGTVYACIVILIYFLTFYRVLPLTSKWNTVSVT